MIIQSNKVITLQNRKTCIRLADIEWETINTLCEMENFKRKTLFELIEKYKDPKCGLTYAIRLFATIYFHQFNILNASKNIKRHQNSPIFAAIMGIK